MSRWSRHAHRAALALALVAPTFGVSFPVPASESGFRQEGAHVHGHAVLSVVREGRDLVVELESPALNLVGFEHAPADGAQRALIEQALADLADPSALLVLPPAAGCVRQDGEVETDLLAEAAHGGDHGSGHEGDGESHADFHVRHVFRCDDPEALERAEVRLFDRFPEMEEIEAVVIGPRGQSTQDLAPGAATLKL